MHAKDISIKAYNYTLPDERIAKYPLRERDKSKLLIYRKGEVSEDVFSNLPDYLPHGALMVFNNTKVIRARLRFHKDTGAAIEIFLLEPATPADYALNFGSCGHCTWYCLVGNLKKWHEGMLTRTVNICGDEISLSATRVDANSIGHRITFRWTGGHTWAEMLEAAGETPIPPYLNRQPDATDKLAYQTVYSKVEGSVAAPTAGLHFTEGVLSKLCQRGLEREEVTLHVGAGTFLPVKSETIGGHEMHTEHIAVNRHTIERLLRHKGRAIAVGTTCVRTLESLYFMGIKAKALMCSGASVGDGYELRTEQWDSYTLTEYGFALPSAEEAMDSLLRYMDRHSLSVLHSCTQLVIVPGYKYNIVQMMLTNFHQPQSTLLLLVSAFVGDDWHTIYNYALSHDFRFLSYGDSSLLIP